MEQKTFFFSKKRYFKFCGPKYVIGWILVYFILCSITYFKRNLTITSSTSICIVTLIFTLLLFFNRIRTWSKSKIEFDDPCIQYTKIKADGYIGGFAVYRREGILYEINRIDSYNVTIRGLIIKGSIKKQIIKYENNSLSSSKIIEMQDVLIPPYFVDIDILTALINSVGGNYNE